MELNVRDVETTFNKPDTCVKCSGRLHFNVHDNSRKMEIKAAEWATIEQLESLLKPLQMATNVFCGNNYAPTSMVRPIIFKVINNHMKCIPRDFNLESEFKELVRDLTRWFDLDCRMGSEINSRLIALFLDPRYKDLTDESPRARQRLRDTVLRNLEDISGTQPVEEPSPRLLPTLLQIMIWHFHIGKQNPYRVMSMRTAI